MRQIGIVILAGAVVAASPAAWAEQEDAFQPSEADMESARHLYDGAEADKAQGDAHAARGEAGAAKEAYGRAAQSYLAGYRLSRLPAFLYNLGSVYRLRGEIRWAIRCYRAFLAASPDDPDSLAFLRELKSAVAAGQAGAVPDPALDPGEVCPGEEPVYAESSTHTEEPAHAAELERKEDEHDSEDPSGLEDLGRGADVRPGGGYRAAAWAGAGVTVASAVAAAVTMVQTRSLEEDKQAAIIAYQTAYDDQLDVDDACGDARSRPSPALSAVIDACERGESRARMSKVFTGVALVSAAATGYLFYQGYISESSRQTRPRAAALHPLVSPGAVGAELTLRF